MSRLRSPSVQGPGAARPWADGLGSALLPFAMLAAMLARLASGAESTARPETLFLALWSLTVFFPLTWVRRASIPTLAASAALTAALVALLPRTGGLRPVAVSASLALAIVIVGAQSFSSARRRSAVESAGLALATAFALYAPQLFLHGLSARTILYLGALPVLAAAVADLLARRGRDATGLALGLSLLLTPSLASEPWWSLLAVATMTSVAALAQPPLARWGRSALAAAAAATLLAGSFPWLRPAPIATLARAVVGLGGGIAEMPIRDRAVVLTTQAPTFEVALGGPKIASLIVDSYLTNSVDLPCGLPFVYAELTPPAATDEPPPDSWRAPLLVGRDSAEWAAGRADVRARLRCPAPDPWISWVPGAGRFFGQTTRARLALPKPIAAGRLRLERNPALPPETSIALFFVATER